MQPKQSNYVLESKQELTRLEYQSQISAYDYKEELKGLNLSPGATVLDAGCGAGNVTAYLATLAEGVQVTGWDISKERVSILKQKYKNNSSLQFEVQDLLSPQNSSKFDLILCRYVFHHFPSAQTQTLLSNLTRFLKPNGILRVVEMEGLFSDIYPSSKFLRSALKKIRGSSQIDLQVARKIAPLFFEQGLQEVQCKIKNCDFRDKSLAQEIKNIEFRFENAFSFFKKCLGSSLHVHKLREEYLKAISSPGAVLFYNNFLITGKKQIT